MSPPTTIIVALFTLDVALQAVKILIDTQDIRRARQLRPFRGSIRQRLHWRANAAWINGDLEWAMELPITA